MNKTIKQAERYEAPRIEEHIVSMQTSVLQASVTGNTIESFGDEENL